MSKNIAKVWLFGSESNPGREPYETILYTDGSTSCNCRGWTNLKKDAGGVRSCRHTRLVDMGQADSQAKTGKDYTKNVPKVTQQRKKMDMEPGNKVARRIQWQKV